MRPAGMPLRPGGPGARRSAARRAPMGPGRARRPAARAGARPGRSARRRTRRTRRRPPAKRGAKPKITVADEVDLREFVGAYEEDTYSDISLPLIEKGEGAEEASRREPKPVSKSALRRAAK